MKITFYSNFLNHHQLPFCQEMVNLLGDNFKFVATERIPDERIQMGYEDMNSKYDFVIRSYEDENNALRLALESDVVIIGSAPKKYIYERLKNNIGITFVYSERIYKNNGFKKWLKKIYYRFIKERIKKDNYYLLSASAYSTDDYNSIGLFKNKTYKWGYFPMVKEYCDIKKIMEKKESNSIIWAGRFLDWKHPEIVINIAKKLKDNNIEFKIKMIGNGVLEKNIKNMIKNYHLNDNVLLMGSMSPNEVRKHMEKSKIFLFTSDKGEGWGAVLNEAMNSGCAVVASHEIGSVPFLIEDKHNGLIYENGNLDDLYYKIHKLLEDESETNRLGINAYKTMIDLWNPKVAANRIVELSKSLLKHENIILYEDGPCSKSERLKDDWYLKQ